jgi:hypothetical protein
MFAVIAQELDGIGVSLKHSLNSAIWHISAPALNPQLACLALQPHPVADTLHPAQNSYFYSHL